jgi:hypothetical protein
MAQNIQTFAGDVVVPGTLRANLVTIEDPILTLGSNNYVDKASNTGFIINRFDSNANVAFYFDETNEQLRLAYTDSVGTDKNIIVDEETDLEINVFGYVSAYGFRGDGGLLSNLVTDLQSVTEYGASSDQTLVLSNVTTALDVTQGNAVVSGNVTASTFFGDGANLTGIAATLEEIIINGNVTSNVMELQNATSLITTGKVGIMNAAPQHDLSVGANLYVEDVGSNVLTVEGNISAHQITLGTIEIVPSYGLENVTNVSNISYQTLILSNAQTAFVSTGKAGIGIEPDAGDVGVSGLHVDGHLRLGGAADNTDEESMDIKAAGALNVLANESDTDNTNTGLLLRAGGVNESNITMYGDLSTADKQYMSFATRSEERMRIDRHGNVSIGHTAGNYMFDVAGDANVQSLTVQDLTINTIGLSVLYDVDNILENGNVTTNVLTVGKVTVTDPTLAQTASNLVTWNATTKEFEDSGGLISNKLAIVSEQPPVALTGDSTVVDGHGTYKVTASVSATDGDYVTWRMFDKVVGTGWSTGIGGYYDFSGTHTGDGTLGGVNGEWLKLELPYKTILRHISLVPRNTSSYTCMPEVFTILGSNDNSSWTTLKAFTGQTWNSLDEIKYLIDASTYYKYYAIVVEETNTNFAAIGEWRLFTESFAIDGGKVALAAAAITGGNTVVDQTGPHARASPPLRKYPEVPLTSNIHGGYVVSASSNYDDYAYPTEYVEWLSFNGLTGGSNPGWVSDDSPAGYDSSTRLATGNGNDSLTGIVGVNGVRNGAWLKLKLPHKIKLKEVHLYDRYLSPNERVYEAYIYGSNDDSTWYTLGQQSTGTNLTTYTDRTPCVVTISDQTTAYKYFIVQPTQLSSQHNVGYASYGQVELYGYEETSDPDTSVDTTITSQFNLPDTTGVKLYIDGDKGSTPTDYSGEGHTLTDDSESFSGNAWSFSSLATSNVTMTSGDLAMEGTHPHSVSLWFNAANVSSNATLFHVGTASGEGDAKTSISLTETGHLGWIDGGDNQFVTSNTWHNLVYATQGAGGVRTCYLDGRKLGDAQVQDTFGDYPPFAMTTYLQGGYMVSSSTEFSGYAAWEAFDDITGSLGTTTYWSGSAQVYSNGNWNGGTSSTYTTNVEGTNKYGEWLQIEFPHKIKYSYSTILAPYDHEERVPRDGYIVGSNDTSGPWTTLHRFEDVTRTSTSETVTYVPSSAPTQAFKYLRIVIENMTSGGGNYAGIDQWNIYGHKENDTTRFPVSSTVLKYPHIDVGVPRDNPAKRGYVVTTGSSIYSGRTGARAFDDQPTGDGWETNSSSYDLNNSGVAQTGTDTFGSYTGHWIKLQLPRKIVVSSIDINAYWNSTSQADDRRPDAGAFLGSNDDSTWELIHAFGSGTLSWSLGDSSSTYETNISSMSASNTNAYKYIVFVITNKAYGGSPTVTTTRTAIRLLRYYGTEPEDVIARVGEGLDGKVANFRVYDKYLHEEQALELWEAQKDQFGRATSSVSVYRGHVGIGTTTPEGRFAVLDEPGDVVQLPPGNMTADDQYFEGHGVFRARTSPGHNTVGYPPWEGFNDTIGTLWYTGYHPNSAPSYNGTSGAYSNTAQLGSTTVLGEYLVLEMPYKVYPERLEYTRQSGGAHLITNAFVYGRVGNGIWKEIGSFTDGGPPDDWVPKVVDLDSSDAYDQLAFIPTKRYAASDTAGVSAHLVRYFGTRERGQSTLHDGELKLTKNLTVPRIGPPLDADDTPRRDRLVVEYNTSTNPTENGTVRDTSGRGNDGMLYGNATYDATEKALVFDGSGDYVEGLVHNSAGEWLHSVSMWFKQNTEDSYDTLFHLGDQSSSKCISIRRFSSGEIRYNFYDADIEASPSVVIGEWYHLVVTYSGGTDIVNRNMYLNGVKQTLVTSNGTAVVLNLNPNERFTLATQSQPIEGQMNCDISNFKLYDVALTAKEVKRLYDMGRLGNVIAQPVHIAAPVVNGISFHGYKGSFFYDEGTFTPSFDYVTVNSYALQEGMYVRVGRLVTIHVRINADFDTADGSAIHIGGLPYTALNGSALFTMDTEDSTLFSESSFTSMGAQMRNNGENVCITNANTYVKYQNCTNNGTLVCMFQYFI